MMTTEEVDQKSALEQYWVHSTQGVRNVPIGLREKANP
jgi:hypothetical protein